MFSVQYSCLPQDNPEGLKRVQAGVWTITFCNPTYRHAAYKTSKTYCQQNYHLRMWQLQSFTCQNNNSLLLKLSESAEHLDEGLASYGLGDQFPTWTICLLHYVQTNSGAHPVSCTVNTTAYFPTAQNGLGKWVMTHFNQVWRLKMHGALPPLLPFAFMPRCLTKHADTFYF